MAPRRNRPDKYPPASRTKKPFAPQPEKSSPAQTKKPPAPQPVKHLPGQSRRRADPGNRRTQRRPESRKRFFSGGGREEGREGGAGTTGRQFRTTPTRVIPGQRKIPGLRVGDRDYSVTTVHTPGGMRLVLFLLVREIARFHIRDILRHSVGHNGIQVGITAQEAR